MMGFNHLAGGFAFTATFASFSDTNIFETPERIAATAFFALLPDVDHRSSLIGKLFYPVAKYLDTHYGHRTITHSFPALVAVTAMVLLVENALELSHHAYALIACLAYLSHLVFDMCTRAGIPFFIPFTKRRCVLPANPAMRLRAGDLRSEALVFFAFIGMNFLCWDLYEKGFWTKYNEAFSTVMHLEKEYQKGRGLHARFKSVEGDVVTFQSGKPLLMVSGRLQLVSSDEPLLSFSDGPRYRIETVSLVSVSADSLNQLLAGHFIEAVIRSEEPFQYPDGSGLLATGNSATLTNSQHVTIQPTRKRSEQLTEKLFQLEARIFEQRQEEKSSRLALKQLETKRQLLMEGFTAMSDYEKGKAIGELKTLKTKIEGFEVVTADTLLLDRERQQLLMEMEKIQVFDAVVRRVIKSP
ncbi:metal-dependent hydrolase [Limibacter armeniacum]|uniref:metal-dependent hydrolase n=1 Tax=Limibacter armeniacum TaxID=466084 RepID=UPI002FE57D02